MSSSRTRVPRSALVTGGEGFLGSHLVAYLAAAGVGVVSLDDRSSPAGPGVPRPGVGSRRIERVVGSVLDAELVDSLVSRVDAVFHLAARVGVRRVLADPLATLEVNTLGTQVVLEACARHGVRALYTSSSEVYGHGLRVPFSEEDPLVLGRSDASRWGYAVSKLHGEFLGFALAAQRGLPFVAVRLFNVVGPGQRADQGMVLPRFVAAAVAERPIVVHGPGTQRRSFVHPTDVSAALWDLLSTHESGADVFNVGADTAVSVLELAERVRSIVGSSSPIEIVDPVEHMPPGFVEVTDRWPRLDRLRARIGARPLIPLDDIIAQTAGSMSLAPTGT